MVSFPSGLMYFVGLEVILSVFGKFSNKIHFIGRMFNFALTTMAACTISICCSPILIIMGSRTNINWLTGRVFYFLSRFFLGFTVEIEGQEHLDSKSPYVFIGNHQSYFDIVWLGATFPKKSVILSKKSVKYFPFVGWLMILGDDIFINRGSKQSTSDMFKKASEILLAKKINVFFFPEGTRGTHKLGPSLFPFKKGAFLLARHAKVPIVPLVVSDFHNIQNPKNWWSTGGTIKLRVLPPIPMDKATDENLDDTIKKTWESMHSTLLEISPPRIDFKKLN
ncbi:hypothetical protein BB558_002967 [Smittium angustum]|uniref:1-acyl-sn-glycerol-3-phosphate acyltransferase n=1 Tax=Smittium angustum TaxID=133377 RepID=A0A2U1J790_SMIAN|nr:hypothetical protein BB558_002967 [Smittium angustum]